MTCAFQVQQRFDERAEVAVYRMGSGWRRMESHLHTCSSFLSASVTGCPEVEMILAFLDARHVTSLSASFAAGRKCRNGVHILVRLGLGDLSGTQN